MVNGLKIKALFIFLLASLYSSFSLADITIDNDFQYLNQLRVDAQLAPFKWNQNLADSAQNHANYLTANNKHGHRQQRGFIHYTGEWVSERALKAHYQNRLVSENVTSKMGDNSFYNPIDSLMSAIYHRFGFLDLYNNEIGIGHKNGGIHSYVYVMGNEKLSTLCQQPPFKGYGEYNFEICVDEKQRLDKKQVVELKHKSRLLNAKIVLWPSKNARNVLPVFYEESPDPLPHHGVSSYPISIQFNPAYFTKAPQVTSFTLRPAEADEALKPITLMSKDNDPNQQFTEFQHALFLEHRFDWNTQYLASVKYTDLDTLKQHQLNWSFHTKKLNARIVKITRSNQTFKVKKGEQLVLYFPPAHAHDTQTALSYRDFNMNIKLNYIDQNTLNAYITKRGKAEITFHNKTITLKTH